MRDQLTALRLRAAIREKFAWPGGYEIYGITSDCGVLCCDCMRREYRLIAYARRHNYNDDWNVQAIALDCETDAHTACDHCGRTIIEDFCENENN